MNRLSVVIVASVVFAIGLQAKKRPPTLDERYSQLSCAVVQIASMEGAGTGFFVSRSGDVVTAGHVALNQTFSETPTGQIANRIEYKPGLRVRQSGNRTTALPSLPRLTEDDTARALSDLVILRTGIETPCFLKLGKHPKDLEIGQHLIAMGYPESEPEAADSALYEGFVSARYRHLAIPIAVVNGQPIYPNYDVVRIQMPITPGVSGGPVLADDNDVIGVVTENPTIWFNDLNSLIAYGQQTNGGFNAPVSDLPKLVSKLAWVTHEFLSSGAGLAVPVSYLEVKATTAR
jgi:S1-C subfamily serine protease